MKKSVRANPLVCPRRAWVFAFLIITVLLYPDPFSVEAVNTMFWETGSQRDFSRGEMDGISITSEGEVVLAPKLTPVLNTEDKELFVWALAMDADENLYAATGNNGRIFKVSKEGTSSLFFDSPEVSILSLALDAQGHIYAGSSPDGVIYKIDPQGTYRTFFNTGETYVWALVVDNSGNLFAATGDKGRIYKISPEGKSRILFDSGQPHITSLISDGQGGFYAGSEGDGIIYRVSPEGKVSVLYDAEENEIRSLVLDRQGNLYAAALASRTTPPVSRDRKPPEEKDPKETKEKRSIKTSSIYKITPEGTVTKIWSSPSSFIYSMILDKNDKLLVGTDDRSMVYEVSSDGEFTTLFHTDKTQVLSLLQGTNQDLYLGTGDTAMVYKVDLHPREKGTLLSPTYDAQIISKWGKLSWKGTSQGIKFMTRTGNTEKPDSTWSPWSGEYTDKDGTPITSPPARFIQWKAILEPVSGLDSPVLKEVTVSYLPKNLSPRISRLNVISFREEPPVPPPIKEVKKSEDREEKSEEKTPPPPNPVRRVKLERGKKLITWIAEDPNNDTLAYELYFRGEEEKNWKLLEQDIRESSYILETESLPDGWYQIKVKATDAPSNPADKALTTEKVSELFLIDNTPPVVKFISTHREETTGDLIVSIQAVDNASLIKNAQYSLDAGEWKTIFPKDEIFDSKEEEFEISLKNLSPGEHTLVFKVTDSSGNIGAGKTVIQNPPSLSQR
jgi:hypothetical protein